MYGCHQMPAYSKKPKSNLRETDTAAQTSLGLPMYSGMSEKEFERIEKALAKSK
jgi:dTDP-4-amino-4,6-dideoxygalactose transaminase